MRQEPTRLTRLLDELGRIIEAASSVYENIRVLQEADRQDLLQQNPIQSKSPTQEFRDAHHKQCSEARERISLRNLQWDEARKKDEGLRAEASKWFSGAVPYGAGIFEIWQRAAQSADLELYEPDDSANSFLVGSLVRFLDCLNEARDVLEPKAVSRPVGTQDDSPHTSQADTPVVLDRSL